MVDADKKQRCGFISLVGLPNAGKSTLLNALVGQKVSIVTHKAQTTRFRLRGIALHQNTQMIFVDTPGIFSAKTTLEKALVKDAETALGECDLHLLVVDVKRGITDEVENLLGKLKGKRCALILNKMDLIQKERLLYLAKELNDMLPFERTFMISALNEFGVQDIIHDIADMLPEGPWHYPEDQLSDLPMRMMAAEITREKLFLRLHQELPYSLMVETESWEDFDNGDIKINQVIYLQRESHKPIVLGKNGETVKKIGQLAREELTKLFDRKVHLFLHVKVRENWQEKPEFYNKMGLQLH